MLIPCNSGEVCIAYYRAWTAAFKRVNVVPRDAVKWPIPVRMCASTARVPTP